MSGSAASPVRGRDESTAAERLATLVRLAAEAEMVEQLLAHVEGRRREALARRGRLEQRLAAMEDPARVENGALLAAEVAAIESLLTRLRVAASLAQAFARLRAAEAGSLIDRAACSEGTGAATDASVILDTGPNELEVYWESPDASPAAEREDRIEVAG